MFHVKQLIKSLLNKPIHELLFYVFLFSIPIQTRILYHPDLAYSDWYFNYHLAIFVYLSDILLLSCFISWFIIGRPWNGKSESASDQGSRGSLTAELPLFCREPIASSSQEVRTPRKFAQNRLLWLILAFFAITLLSLAHLPAGQMGVKRPDLGWYQAIKWGELLLLLIYVSQTFKSQIQILIACWVIFLSAIFQSILGLVQFHVQHSFGLGFLGEFIAPLGTPGLANILVEGQRLIRAYGTFPHPNIFGAYLVFGLISGLLLVSYATKRQKTLISIGLLVITLGLFVSFSRLAWLAASLAIIGIVVYYLMKQRRGLAIAILIPVLVSCATILIWTPKTLKARVSDANSVSATDRYFFDRLGIDLFRHHPLLGVGAGNYVPALIDTSKLDAWQYQPAHNIFIFIAAELGVLGVALFLLILFEIFWRLKSVPGDTLTFAVVVLGIIFLLMGQFDHYFVTIQQGRLMFFTVLGLIAALPNIYAEKSD